MLRFWSDLGITLIMAVSLYLIIEAPFSGLEYFLRPKTKNSAVSKATVPSNETQQSNVNEKDLRNLDGPSILAESSNAA